MWPKTTGAFSRIIKHHVAHSASESVSAAPGARVVAISSGKGGVGKTNLTVNLALALAELGKKVIIFDADLGLANAQVLLGVAPALSMYDCLYGGRSIEEVIYPVTRGIWLVSGGSGIVELANLDQERRQHLVRAIDYLESAADYLLLDTGAGISKEVLGFVAAAREVIIVLTPEPTSLTDAYSLIKIIDRFHLHNQVYIVVNRAQDQNEARQTVARLEKVINQFLTLKTLPLGFVLDDRTVGRAVKQQKPVYLLAPQSSAAICFKEIAARLDGQKTGQLDMPVLERGAGGFVRKLLRLFG